MDPLSALGLAANVAQFLDVGVSIFKDARQISSTGNTISTTHLVSLASSMEKMAASLTGQCESLKSNLLSADEEVTVPIVCRVPNACAE